MKGYQLTEKKQAKELEKKWLVYRGETRVVFQNSSDFLILKNSYEMITNHNKSISYIRII